MQKIFFLFCFVISSASAQNSLLDHFDSNELSISDNSDQISSNDGKFCDGNMLFNQIPNQTNGLFIDTDCDSCPTGVQFVADNFTLLADNTLGQFVIHTGYFPGNVPITDSWTLTVHEDTASLPGAVIYTEANVASTRVGTGVSLFGVDEYQVVLTPSTAIPLLAGTYWIEIHNDSTGSTDNVFWETGSADINTIAGNVFATEDPVVTWNSDTWDLAVQICQEAFDLDVNVTGLAPTNSVTVANDKDLLVISSNGTSKISGLSDGVAYSVSITQQPDTPNQVCSVTSGNASGNMSSSGVSVDINLCYHTIQC